LNNAKRLKVYTYDTLGSLLTDDKEPKLSNMVFLKTRGLGYKGINIEDSADDPTGFIFEKRHFKGIRYEETGGAGGDKTED